MWIRSQSKQALVDAKRILYYIDVHGDHKIINQVLYQEKADDYDLLGGYSDLVRIIEVLDDIENSIINRDKMFNMPLK